MQKLSYLTSAIADKNDGQLLNQALKGIYNRFSTQIFNSGAIAIGTTKQKVKTAAAIYGTVNGVLFSKAITDDAFTLAGTVTNAKFNVYCLYLDVTGAVSAAMGAEGAALVNVKFPPLPENKVMVGFVVINPTGTGNFVGGTTALDDATVVPNAVYVNTIGAFDPTAVI